MPSSTPPSGPSTALRLTLYYTPVESFYSGAPQTTSAGTYPSDFLNAVQTEGSGKLSANHYINYTTSNGYSLDSLPRDAQGNPRIPYRSAAADPSIALGTTFQLTGCGTDATSGSPIASSVCLQYQWPSAWVVTDRFNASATGSHIGLYVGEQTSATFASGSNVVSTVGATITTGAPIGSPAWKPAPSDTYQIILGSSLDTTAPASFYEIDGDSAASDVATLHGLNRHAACYLDGGSWESYRSDASSFPAQVLGNAYAGFPDERWLDIRQIGLLGPIMQKRLDACAAKGFDAVHPDNMNGYEDPTGFTISAADQIVYNTWFASLAHERHLAIAFDDTDQVQQLVSSYDYGLIESCSAQGCGAFSPFHANGKPVFVIEYTNATSSATFTGTYCPQDEALGFDVILKNPSADAWIETCP